MVKKLTQHGNSLALIIDRAILDLLNFDGDTLLEVTTDGKRLIVEPLNGRAGRKKFEEAMRKTHRRFAKTFKRLAE